MKKSHSYIHILSIMLGIVAQTPDAVFAASSTNYVGAVFVGTNHTNMNAKDSFGKIDLSGHEPSNRVAMYLRADDGSLTFASYYLTGGQGSGPSQRFAGDGLGASHSIQISENRKWLFVTNAGSNTVSVFSIKANGLQLTDVVATGDGSASQRFPNSVTQKDNLVYVLNSAGNGSITGFTLSASGELTPIPNSLRTLDANQPRFAPDPINNPAQVSFTPDGKQLIVSIKDGPATGAVSDAPATGPGRILVFNLDKKGSPLPNYKQTTFNNGGPFGFSFDRNGNLLTSLFVGGPKLTGAAGSFKVEKNGTLTPITPLVPNFQLDTCWLENNGVYAFGANYSSGTISTYQINNGQLTLIEQAAGTTAAPGNKQGSTPLDLGVSPDGQFLYDVLPGSGKVAAWRINANGSLTKIDEYTGVGQTTDGDTSSADFTNGNSPAGIAVY